MTPDSFPSAAPDGLVKIENSDGEKCAIKVDPHSAQSLIHFLLEKQIRLLPPEGGVARNPDYQVEMAGVPRTHSFFAYGEADKLRELAAEWQARASRQPDHSP